MIDSFGEKVELTKEDDFRWKIKYNADVYVIDFYDNDYFIAKESYSSDGDWILTEMVMYDNAFDLAKYILESIVD